MRRSVLAPVSAGALAVLLLTSGAMGASPSPAAPSAGPRWERVALDPAVTSGARMTDVVATATGWVAVGMDDAGRTLAWTSADGRTWQRHELPRSRELPQVSSGAGTLGQPEGPMVAAGDGLLVVLDRGTTLPGSNLTGYGARHLWTSVDGIDWTLVGTADAGLDPMPSPPKQPWLGLTPGPLVDLLATDSGYAAVGWASYRGRTVPEIATSADGASWSITRERTSLVQPPKEMSRLPFLDLALTGITRTPDGLLAVGDRTTLRNAVTCDIDADIVLVRSRDGTKWRLSGPSGLRVKGHQSALAVAAADGREVIVGAKAANPKRGRCAPTRWGAAAWYGSGDRWKAAAIERPEGIAPTAVTMAVVAPDASGGFVATGWWTDDAGTHPAAWSSPNGARWTLVPVGELPPAPVSSPGPSAPASPGASSEPAGASLPADTRMEAIAAGPSGMVAVGRSPEGAAVWIASR